LVIASLLLDLKQQRAELAALEQEIRDRIANRTDALERKIGTLQLQATRDGLTGLGNRRGLDLQLDRMIETCRAANTDAALLMIDVDHFKPLNDTLGHAAGDQLLREIAQLIRSNLRSDDQAYRAGGDEFVVLMPCANMEAATTLATRLASLVAGLTHSLAVRHPPQLSIGIAILSELKDATPKEFLHVADGRLYAVKSLRPRTRRSA
jgi:diguanylate cyclase (GGDEF)-like protein